jgi:hypothetical protein
MNLEQEQASAGILMDFLHTAEVDGDMGVFGLVEQIIRDYLKVNEDSDDFYELREIIIGEMEDGIINAIPAGIKKLEESRNNPLTKQS